jgi:general secretion pathway protein D
MKIIRNSLLGLLSTLVLLACQNNPLQNNPLIINKSIFSLDDERAKKVASKDKQQQLTIFKPKSVQTYRDNKQIIVNADNKTRVANKSEKKNEQQLIRNGSIPAINTGQEKNNPQVVDKKGNIQNADEIVQLDYEQIEIRQILEELADVLGMSIVIDPSIKGKITMRTSPNQPLRNKDLWQVLNMLLHESGISLEKKSGLYYAKKSPLTIPAEVGYPSLIKDSNASIAMQITPLKNISASAAITMLKPIMGAKSKISQIAQLNMLAIIGSTDQLSRINGLLALVDADPFKHRGIRLYQIKNTEAVKIAKELEEVLKLIDGDKSSYQVLALDRINSILVVAPPRRGFKAVDRWVKILDESSDNTLQEQIFIYHCKSVECETLAGTLNSIFEKTDSQSSDKTKNASASSANVFRTVPKDSLNVKSKNKSKKATPKAATNKTTASKNKSKNSADIDVTIVADADTNSLIVRTTGKDYRSLLNTIKLLDQIPLQVLVNVVIAQVSLNNGQSLGLDWQYTNPIAADTIAGTAISSAGAGFAISTVSGHFEAKLSALALTEDANILSRPSLLISNNKEGAINVGTEVPVQTSSTTNLDSSAGITNQVTQEISYRTTGIELKVKPHINEDGVITMEITQSLSAIQGSTTSQDAAFKPTFTNQDISTTVVVGDGETIILGGLIDTTTAYNDSGIPVLKDLPGLGYLFKTQGESEQRRELMLIITPKIIGPETNLEAFGQDFSSHFRAVVHYIDKELNPNYKLQVGENSK